ncbi:MAG TPA: TlpA disulfide reductase family protein [Polyangiaceae bacterium]|nr:TlpA disulfide reductase family protein [Polyangiaceae bacterium]
MRSFIVVFALAACVSCAEGVDPASSSAGPGKTGLIGDRAPDFDVTPVTGSRAPISLRALRGTVVVVDFWGTYCGPCKQSFPKLEGLRARYAERGLRVLGISEDEADDKAKIPSFAATYGAKFAIAWDEDKSIARMYKPETMPSTFVIDRKGIVRYEHVGYHDGDERELEKEVKDLLAE